jgi:2,3-dihydroxy-p-cumate/2,3-dihydroxybenzoate 3,4-dioxygenase
MVVLMKRHAGWPHLRAGQQFMTIASLQTSAAPNAVLEKLCYVRIGVPDLAAAAAFATRILGLEPAGGDDARAFFKSDFRDYSLCFVATDQAYSCLAFEVRTMERLDDVAASLQALGLRPRRGEPQDCAERRVKAFVAFSDFSGNEVEIVWRPLVSGWRFFPSRDTGIQGLLSVDVRSTHIAEDEPLWTQIFGAEVSDRVGDGCYLRIDDMHHRLSLHPSDKAGILSINFAVEGIDQIMQSSYFLHDSQSRIVHGPGRTPASGEIFLRFEAPGGQVFSFSTGMDRISDEHRTRQYRQAAGSHCLWGSQSLLPEFGALEQMGGR